MSKRNFKFEKVRETKAIKVALLIVRDEVHMVDMYFEK